MHAAACMWACLRYRPFQYLQEVWERIEEVLVPSSVWICQVGGYMHWPASLSGATVAGWESPITFLNLPGLRDKCIGWNHCLRQRLRDEKVLSLFETRAVMEAFFPWSGLAYKRRLSWQEGPEDPSLLHDLLWQATVSFGHTRSCLHVGLS